MNTKQRKKLVTQIARLCEKQYRKGFQHGFYACDQNKLTQAQVDVFRTKGEVQDYKKVVDPFTKQVENAIDRLLAEIAMNDMNELESLLSGRDSDLET